MIRHIYTFVQLSLRHMSPILNNIMPISASWAIPCPHQSDSTPYSSPQARINTRDARRVAKPFCQRALSDITDALPPIDVIYDSLSIDYHSGIVLWRSGKREIDHICYLQKFTSEHRDNGILHYQQIHIVIYAASTLARRIEIYVNNVIASPEEYCE